MQDTQALRIIDGADFQPRQWQALLPKNSTFKRAFTSFIAQYGHRAVYEIDLSRPRWREDPSYLLSCIKRYPNLPDAKASVSNRKQASENAWREIRQHIPCYLRHYIKKQIKTAAQGAEPKEISKSTYVRLMEPIRLAFVEMGKRLAQRNVLESADDIFHCALCEIVAVLQNEWDGHGLKILIAERKAIKLAQEKLPAPDVIIDDTPHQITSHSANSAPGLRGIGVAMGIASGAARLVRIPEDGHRLSPGDVLVAPSTDPAWTPLFLNASAIVMETGGYLSHGSIVAREYGIPAVVNIPGLFNAVKEGGHLRVNGDQGVVEIVI
jgi:rifampicin phosphotransferase